MTERGAVLAATVRSPRSLKTVTQMQTENAMQTGKAKSILLSVLVLLSGSAFAAEHTVKMLNQGMDGIMVFEPGYLKVNPGDTVKFVPVDVGHDAKSVLVPEGGVTWDSGISQGVTITLTTEGVYLYECEPHLPLAMVGVIQVGDAVNLAAAKAKAAEMKKQFYNHKERLDNYLEQVR